MRIITFKADASTEKKIEDLVKHLQGHHMSKVYQSDVIRHALEHLYNDIMPKTVGENLVDQKQIERT